MNKIMGTGKTDVLFVEHHVRQDPFHIISVDPVVADHVHVGHGSRSFSYFQMADVEPFAAQRLDHPFSVLIGAGRRND